MASSIFAKWLSVMDTIKHADETMGESRCGDIVIGAAVSRALAIEEEITRSLGPPIEKLKIALHHATLAAKGGDLDRNWILVACAIAQMESEPVHQCAESAILPRVDA